MSTSEKLSFSLNRKMREMFREEAKDKGNPTKEGYPMKEEARNLARKVNGQRHMGKRKDPRVLGFTCRLM